MSRTVSPLAELQPEMFVEVSPELAAQRGLTHLGWAHLVTARAAIEAKVLVTDRLTPLRVDGRIIHQVWLPYHFGFEGLVDRRLGQRPVRHHPRPERPDPGEQGRHLRRPARTTPAGTGPAGPRRRLPAAVGKTSVHRYPPMVTTDVADSSSDQEA